jgi:hypothetical protein
MARRGFSKILDRMDRELAFGIARADCFARGKLKGCTLQEIGDRVDLTAENPDRTASCQSTSP